MLFGVLPVLFASFNASESFCNLVFCASVAATTKSALAAVNSALLAVTLATAWATSSTVAVSLSITAFAFSASCSAAVLAKLYASTVSGVLPGVGSSFTKSSKEAFELVRADLSTFNSCCLSKTSVKNFLYSSVDFKSPFSKLAITSS